jgi:diadenosine tetraphosphate (Ap4A) HIT family hydrolase
MREGKFSREREMAAFSLHPRLEADTVFVADWTLSRVLLMNDARYPWLILVPRRADAVELFELDEADRAVLTEEIARASRGLKALRKAAKINIGALGNLVPQLHVHVVARSPGDAAWPGPVWGQGAAVPYRSPAASAAEVVNAL